MPEAKNGVLPGLKEEEPERLLESKWKERFLEMAVVRIGNKLAKKSRKHLTANIRSALAGATVMEAVVKTKGGDLPALRIGVHPAKIHFLDPTIIDQPAQSFEKQLQRQETAKEVEGILKDVWQELIKQNAVIQIFEDENATLEDAPTYAKREKALTSG